MRSILFAILYLLPITPAWALPIQAGTFTSFDQFGEPVGREDTQRVHEAEKHLAGARKGGELALGFVGEMHLIWPYWFKNGQQLNDEMPNFDDNIGEPLMAVDPLGNPRTLFAFLAESVTVLPDLKTFVVNLRSGVKFSDGTEVKAQHVLDSYTLMRSNGGILLENFFDKYWRTPKLRVIDDRHLEVTCPEVPVEKMRTAIFNFLDLRVVKPNPTPHAFKIPNEYIGTGPYVVTAASDTTVVMKRRADYWAPELPYRNFDVFKVERFRDKSVMREGFTAGTLNMLSQTEYWPVESLTAAEAGSYFSHTDSSSAGAIDMKFNSRFLALNASHPPLDRLNVRKAMVLAYDTDRALYAFYGNRYSSSPSFGLESPYRPTGLPRPEVREFMHDPNLETELEKPFESTGLMEAAVKRSNYERLRRAKELLRADGFVMRDGRLEKDGRPIVLEAIVQQDSPYLRPLLLLQSNLKLLGIRLNLRQASDDSMYEKMYRNSQYDMIVARVNWPRKYVDVPAENIGTRFHSQNATDQFPKGVGTNASNLKSPAIDQLVEELEDMAPGSPTYAERNEALIRLVTAAVPGIPLGEPTLTTFFHDKAICVSGYHGISISSAYYCK